jgi:hypothetical protein
MSIARTAPDSFELQDLVCVELVLRFGASRIDEFLVEPIRGEDGLLTTRTPKIVFELQAKADTRTTSVENIARWLAHFPEYEAENMSIERLIADPDRRLIFVMGGRASSALENIVAPNNWIGDLPNKLTLTLGQELLTTFQLSSIESGATSMLSD